MRRNTCEAAAALKALRTTSVTRWLVSTFPPTTAAVGAGLRMVLGGMRTVIGFRQPCAHSDRGLHSILANLPAGSIQWVLAMSGISRYPKLQGSTLPSPCRT